MKIGVIGAGLVGLTLAAVLASMKFDVRIVDSDAAKIEKIRAGAAPFYEPGMAQLLSDTHKSLGISTVRECVDACDLVFVAVSTPSGPDGGIDLGNVRQVSEDIGESLSESENRPVIVIKSTVIPGTSRDMIRLIERVSKKESGAGFDLVASPEFIREGSAVHDTLHPHAVVIGGQSAAAVRRVEEFYRGIIDDPDVPVIATNHATAEMIKYANNSFLATKITFINQISNICQTVPGVDVDEVARAIGTDPRIGGMFLEAGPGYGGACLSKDLRALASFSARMGHEPAFLNAVREFNDAQADRIVDLIGEALGDLDGKKISILGVSFKENTDNIGESVSVRVIRRMGARAGITLHDPAAMHNAKRVLAGANITYADTIHDALSGSSCAVIMTGWKDYAALDDSDFEKMRNPIVIDARRVLSKKRLAARYYALGIGK